MESVWAEIHDHRSTKIPMVPSKGKVGEKILPGAPSSRASIAAAGLDAAGYNCMRGCL